MEQREQLTNLRATLALTILISALGVYASTKLNFAPSVLFHSRKTLGVLGLSLSGFILGAVLLAVSWTQFQNRIFRLLEAGFRLLQRLRAVNYLFFAASIGLFSYMLLGRFGNYLQNEYLRLLLFWPVVVGGGIFLKAGGVQRSWRELLSASLLFAAFGYKAASYSSNVSTYPFSMEWSETSRYFYASLFFSKQLYGISIPPSVLHPTRYLMQAVPFLISGLPLWFHRLWQVFLWIGVTLLSGYLLARRLSIPDRSRRWMFIAWTFIFLLLGPVYYHLQVPAIIVLWGFSTGEPASASAARRTFWKNLGIVLLASVWAGISRINWFPVPGMLAATLYFLEVPVQNQKFWRYLAQPVLWTAAGTLTAFASEAVYVVWSGNPTQEFTSSLTSDLLWYRLFPNPTYPAGVIPDILLVSLPLVLLVMAHLSGKWKAFHPLRLWGVGAVLLMLFAGGIVVSTKIGGGSNLHNLDAFLTLLMIVSATIFFGKIKSEPSLEIQSADAGDLAARPLGNLSASLLAIVILIPAYFALGSGSPADLPNARTTRNAMATITKYVDAAVKQGGEVLFIDQRQLITFHYINGVAMFPDYEKVFLMEMAMAGNPAYLGRFDNDLKNHRFALIVSEPLFITYKGAAESFGEENDAWVKNVATKVLCYYEPQKTVRGVRVQLLTPRSDAGACQ
jgi:hypothetical protein